MSAIDLNVRLVIFDVDGTLYDQQRLRRRMLIQIFGHYVFRPHLLTELKILSTFRKQREIRSENPAENQDIIKNQYLWCHKETGADLELIKSIVNKWIHQVPLKHLKRYRYDYIHLFLNALKKKNITTAVLSDYAAEGKLSALHLDFDYVFSAEQAEINVLKPKPDGIHHILNFLGFDTSETLFIGDRPEKDGRCAAAAGVKYLNVNKSAPNQFYKNLLNELN